MKTSKIALSAFVPLVLVLASGCSTLSGGKSTSAENLAANGPTVIDARSNPSTFELNRDLQATGPTEILADVKDFNSEVTDVKLRFVHVPLEIAMENIGGSTWRAVLTQEQLKQLAVGGQTMQYQVNVIATNADGMTAVSNKPVDVAVKAPDLAQPTG